MPEHSSAHQHSNAHQHSCEHSPNTEPHSHHSHEHGPHNNASQPDASADPAKFWEKRYGGQDRVWSGRVNATLADVASQWSPGRSLDLGCGEGGDVIWLAERGWQATGIDISATATVRATAAARERGATSARFIAADLAHWIEDPARIDSSEHGFDLVTASFLQSPVALPRERILRAAAARVAAGGRLVVVAHAEPPAWAKGHGGDFPVPEEDLAALELDARAWEIEACETRERATTAPDGTASTLLDSLVIVRRR
ncbi:class I SAM-dependent methyltransferase [Leucobacter sp. USHLN153]|uniref:class I SAM-dependent methyltransferase n=1 Tax=Leucobacter sp. USHLN153 TaxID=3081268 RepID=UPI00301776E0